VTTLSTEQLARMSRLLDEVIDLDETGRRKWLQALGPEHRDLEPELWHALFPRAEMPFTLPRISLGSEARVESRFFAGDLVGPYRLLRRLGTGGMAEVWLAQRADGAFKREVALKIPVHLERREDLAQRFLIERDILAALEHPHIARFYDAGVSQNGGPYLALEYVAGKNVLKWADAHRLGVRERIEIFLQVLDAVQYAHEHGVLHRDIKPGNVLVTDAGRVSLLDFGVAKLMEPCAEAELTMVYGHALTPEYASPEQLKGGRIEAASDVFSLGVVLYELLAGRRPFQVERDPDSTVEPPSVRLDEKAAAVRGGSIARIGRLLEGDLDAIAVKALSPSVSDRYQSAAALAQDLRRYLAGDVVQAVPPSLLYKARKVVAKNRVSVFLAAALAVVFIGMLYERLHMQGGETPAAQIEAAAPSVSAPVENKSIAVLPFVDLSEQHDQEYFSDGLTEELIDRLARSRDLRVIARTSAFAFKGRNEDARSIAATLGVSYLLTGSVRKNDKALRIAAQLVRASDGTQLWSQTYERTLADIFKVQDEIAATVAQALETALSDRSAEAGKEPNVEAYNLVLQGDVFTNGPFKRDAELAAMAFRKATALDPNYALPWAKLGLLYLREAYLAWAPKNQANEQARQAIETALQIDPRSMAAHAARFRYLVRVDYQWADARAELDRMRAIDPNDAVHLPECEAYFARVMGNLNEAIRIQKRIVDRDPLNASALGTLAAYLFESDRFEESVALFRQQSPLNPHGVANRALVGVALALLGRGEEALDEISRERHEGYQLWAYSIAFSTLGRSAESDAALHEMMKFVRGNAYSIAQIYAFRGDRNRAFEWLTRACVDDQSGCETIKSDRFLRSLHDDPRYVALLAHMKLDGDAPSVR
jgi:TolB-like protein